MYKSNQTTVINGPAWLCHQMAEYFIRGIRGNRDFPDEPPEPSEHEIIKVVVLHNNGYFGDNDDINGMWLFAAGPDEDKALIYIPGLHLDAQPYGRMLLNEVLGIDHRLILEVAGSIMSGSDYELIFERFADGTWTAEHRPITPSRPRSVK